MHKRLAALTLLFILSSLKVLGQITQQKEPLWVDNISYKELQVTDDDITNGTILLVQDQQIHIPKETVYYRVTTKITDNVGVQSASTINVEYDPSYQRLKFHKISIIREGQVIDKLDLSNFQTLRKESNAENYLYDGSLSAMMNLTDVRTGDIIDYSYSLIGFNPIHKNKSSTSFYLNNYNSVGVINVSILSKNTLRYKTFNNAIKPEISNYNGLQKYQWNVKNPEKVHFEENIPIWKVIHDLVIISDYNSWEDVVNWGLNVYAVNEKLSPELQSKIKEINNSSESEGDKIKATLNFVQNNIRYLGLEYGIGAYKPYSPNKVMEQRFGDCKDKSLLMVTMLNEMGIEAYPMLVNTNLQHVIKEFLPSPKFFDHCVVKVINDSEGEHWYDPTITNQGGSHYTTFFLDYGYGLVLKKDNSEFDHIKVSKRGRAETVEEFTLNEIGGGAYLKVTTKYFESEADNMRRYFKMNSTKTISKEFETYYANYYNYISSKEDPKIKDNIEENELIVYEEYQIDSLWEPMPDKKGYISATFIPSTVSGIIYAPAKQKRKNELAVSYPVTKYHDIKVNLPAAWNITNDFSSIDSPNFYYDWRVAYNRKINQVEVSHILKTKKGYVTIDEMADYYKDIDKVENNFGYILYISEDHAKNPSSFNLIGDSANSFFKTAIALIVIIGFALILYFRNQKNQKLNS